MSFLGRWDLTVGLGSDSYPSWLEVNGDSGRFVGKVGSARAVTGIEFDEAVISFALKPQYEGYPGDLKFEGTLKNEVISGTTNTLAGENIPWTAVRAPLLDRAHTPTELETINLMERSWHARWPEMDINWSLTDGEWINAKVGTDLVSDDVFGDFRLVAEYSYPENSNSGIYLRGRYEFPVLDDFGSEPSVGSSAAIYGFITPSTGAIRPFGERNVAQITLRGRTVNVVLNGVTVIDQQEIPGITGGALESHEGEPGPILLQGDHGPVNYHKLELTPLA